MRGRRESRGFTLVELLMTLIVAGVLAAVAIPNYRSFVAKERLKSASQTLFFSMNLARSEAIKLNTPVEVVASNNGWAGGWQVEDPNNAAQPIRVQAALSNIDIAAQDSSGNSFAAVIYDSTGRLTNTAMPTFTVCGTQQLSGLKSQILTIDLSGAPEMSTGANCT